MFVLVTIFMPKGIVGLPAQLRALLKKYRRGKPNGRAGSGGHRVRKSCPPNPNDHPQPQTIRLTLEGVNKSFDGFKAISDLNFLHGRGRAAHHHRPQRRRQKHHDGPHHRPHQAGHRQPSSSAGTPT
jgi:hypothetical protein